VFGRAEWKKGTKAKHEYPIPTNVQYRKKEESLQMGRCSSDDYLIGV
jgi:hypothetical protein